MHTQTIKRQTLKNQVPIFGAFAVITTSYANQPQERHYEYVEPQNWLLNPDGTATIRINGGSEEVLTPSQFALLGEDLYRLIYSGDLMPALGLLLPWIFVGGYSADTTPPTAPNPIIWNMQFLTDALADFNGYSVNAAGDVNGDGFDDFLVSVPLADMGTLYQIGYTSLVFGQSGSGLGDQAFTLEHTGIGSYGINFSDLSAGNDTYWGWSSTGVGDVNADGYDDVLISKNIDESGFVISHLIYGDANAASSSGLIDLSNSSLETNELTNVSNSPFSTLPFRTEKDFRSLKVSSAGDVDGDGMADILIGREYIATNNLPVTNGYLLFGDYLNSQTTTLTLLFDPSGPLPANAGVEIIASLYDDNTGTAIATAGQVRTLGYEDILLGVSDANSSAGSTFMIFGEHLATRPAQLDLFDFDNPSSDTSEIGLRLVGAANNDEAGFAVSSAGDVDGDGFNDILIGAPGANNDTGATYLLFSDFLQSQSSDISLSHLGLNSYGQSNGITITGRALDDRSGAAVSGAGDVDNDGIPDILIGAPEANDAIGEAYLIFGSLLATKPQSIDLDNLGIDQNGRANGVIFLGTNPGSYTGISVANAGDVNDDGYDDILIGGAAYVRRGDPPPSQSYMLSGIDIVDREDDASPGPVIINLSTDYDWA